MDPPVIHWGDLKGSDLHKSCILVIQRGQTCKNSPAKTTPKNNAGLIPKIHRGQ